MDPKEITQNERHTFTVTALKLDSSGNLPIRFALFVTGDWRNSIKGDFRVNLDHLKEMKEHFDAGVGFPTDDATTGLAIDFKHDYQDIAAAWIKGLELSIDPADPTKGTLFANPVEWTDAGAKAVQSGEFKCVSPMGAFGEKNGKLSMWSNPTNLKERFANVLEGAGLTNIPFLRGMSPIRADRSSDLHSGYDNVIYVYDEQTKEPGMNLATLRVKERDQLSVPELDFLGEHKEELSAVEVTKFQLAATTTDVDTADKVSDEDKQMLAAIKDGSKKIIDTASETEEQERLGRLESTVERYRKQEVADLLDKHVKRGAIKQDQAKLDGFWGKQLLDASGEDERKSVKEALAALPSNEQLSKEHGSGEDTAAGSTAREQLDVLAKQMVDQAAKDGKTVLYSDALKKVYHANQDLREQDSLESKSKASVLTAGA